MAGLRCGVPVEVQSRDNFLNLCLVAWLGMKTRKKEHTTWPSVINVIPWVQTIFYWTQSCKPQWRLFNETSKHSPHLISYAVPYNAEIMEVPARGKRTAYPETDPSTYQCEYNLNGHQICQVYGRVEFPERSLHCNRSSERSRGHVRACSYRAIVTVLISDGTVQLKIRVSDSLTCSTISKSEH